MCCGFLSRGGIRSEHSQNLPGWLVSISQLTQHWIGVVNEGIVVPVFWHTKGIVLGGGCWAYVPREGTYLIQVLYYSVWNRVKNFNPLMLVYFCSVPQCIAATVLGNSLQLNDYQDDFCPFWEWTVARKPSLSSLTLLGEVSMVLKVWAADRTAEGHQNEEILSKTANSMEGILE